MTCPNNFKICFHPTAKETYRDAVDDIARDGLEQYAEVARELLRGIHTPTHAFEQLITRVETDMPGLLGFK